MCRILEIRKIYIQIENCKLQIANEEYKLQIANENCKMQNEYICDTQSIIMIEG